MAQQSKIEWTDATWNPTTGCSKVSPGCKHCYAEREAEHQKRLGRKKYENVFELTLHPRSLELPLSWKTPKRTFVNSMSDLFHEGVPLEFIQRALDAMKRAHWHTFQILTKRDERLAEIAPRLPWPPNVWIGVSIETREYLRRVDALRATPAAVKFLSLEPLLGPLGTLDLAGIDWMIVGGESGPKARPMELAWVREIRDQCVEQGIAFFFKQWGGANKKKTGRVLDGRTWDEFPAAKAVAPGSAGATT